MSRIPVITRLISSAGCCAILAAAGVAPAHAGGVYFVKSGDSLHAISRLFKVDVDELRSLNQIEGNAIHPGDRLRIPDHPAGAEVFSPLTTTSAFTAPGRAVDARAIRQALCREERVYHAVARGDNLSAIARRYATSVEELLSLNGLRSRSRLSIGQKLVVRRTGPRVHTVRRGETLQRIASRYRIAPAELQAWNGLPGAAILAGQRLVVEPCDQLAAAGRMPPRLDAHSGQHELGMAVAGAEAAALAAVAARDAQLDLAGAAAEAHPAGIGVTERVINLAKTMLDIPYRFGGTTLRGLDCSAYVQRVFSMLEIPIPRTAREQFHVGERISREELSVGDLVFFRTYASFPSHVGIYLGDNLFIHASSVVRKVTIDSLDRNYYRKRFLGGRRLIEESAPAIASAP